jgi:4-hydroxybenzoate polyprenyltransferase
MRSAGCIVNDILDKEFDAKVFRTKNRPIASGKVSIRLGIFYSVFLCFLALLVLINFNLFTIILAMGSMPLAFTYPLMKRFTYWPQLFLGITFNYGLILGWTAIEGEINFIAILFYLGAIFWTLGYDTIYGYQDIKDDEIIGLKSTSIKFKGNAKKFLISCYSFLIIFFLGGGYFMKFNYIYFVLMLIPIFHLFFYQLKTFNLRDSSSCLKAFKSNNLLGLIIFLNILAGKNLI